MQKVLLAIDGVKPTRAVFDYAVQLCQRLKAELRVLQVIRPARYHSYLQKIRRCADQAQSYLEGSMMAAAFAEAGEPETAESLMAEARKNLNELLPESEKAGVSFRLTTKSGRPGQEIVEYVRRNRDVVVTIYDPSEEERKGSNPGHGCSSVPERIKRRLATPLVVVQQRKAHGIPT